MLQMLVLPISCWLAIFLTRILAALRSGRRHHDTSPPPPAYSKSLPLADDLVESLSMRFLGLVMPYISLL